MKTPSLILLFLSWSCIFTLFATSTPVDRATYIVHMDKSAMPTTFTSHHHWYTSTINSLKSVDPMASPAPSLVYSYNNVAHGFATVLSPKELDTLKKHPGFVHAYKDKQATVDTTHTYKFIGLNPSTGLWPASNYGKDVIIGVIDSGVWPESLSYKDDGMTPVPARWKGICEEGEEFNSSLCNSKLIGARSFNKGVSAANPGTKIIMNSARDTDGHGTHTSSTAAGNYVKDATYFGYATGTARGVAPRSRVAVYKVLWEEGRFASDVLAGIDQAIADGVDVISISMGFGHAPLYEDPVAIASFAAMEKGVLVSTSAGNRGPDFGRVHNANPWALTVAAGTIDRSFSGSLTLGNSKTIRGWTLFPANAIVRNVQLFYNKNFSACNSTELLSHVEIERTIILCDDIGDISFQRHVIAASPNVYGAIFVGQNYFRLLELGSLYSPSVVISPRDARAVIKYATSVKFPLVSIKFQETIVGTTRAPAVASYSSRGPSRVVPAILKPDIMAPGTKVLAAWNPNIMSAVIGSNIFLPSEFNMISGTSMACPHAAGVAALLKVVHPEWSPAAIRSAMMTTANPLDNTQNPIRDHGNDLESASPLAMGAGHIDPNRALDPGLIYDATPQDYVNLLCSMNYTKNQILVITRSNHYNCSNPSVDLNYPSFIALYEDQKSVAVRKFKRTLTNVGEGAATYKATVIAPKLSSITVSPSTLVFSKKHDKQSYTLTISYRYKNWLDAFGSVVWTEENGTHTVRSPVVIWPHVSNL